MSVILSGLEKAEYFTTVRGDGSIASTGKLDPGLFLHNAGNLQCIHNQNENAYLEETNAVGVVSEPLPPQGTELANGEIYAWDGQNVIVRQDHVRTEHDPDTVPALFIVYRESYDGMEWIASEQVSIGDERIYESVTYIVIQAHVTQEDWTPPATPTLWSVKPSETGEWQTGVSYEIDDEVTYSDILYRCIQSHTSQPAWTPPAVPALWTPV